MEQNNLEKIALINKFKRSGLLKSNNSALTNKNVEKTTQTNKDLYINNYKGSFLELFNFIDDFHKNSINIK